MNQTKLFSLITCFLICAASPLMAHTEHADQPNRSGTHTDSGENEDLHINLDTTWANRYLAEGRESFGSEGIFSAAVAVTYGDFSFESWNGFSDESSKREIELTLAYTLSMIPLAPTVGITHINDIGGEPEGWDFSFCLEGEIAYGIEWETSLNYGLNQRGAYLETGLHKTFITPWVNITAGSHLGSNFGYVEEGHDGPDHFALQLELSQEVIGGLEIHGGISHYTPINRRESSHPEDDSLYEGFQFSIGAGYRF